MKKYQIRFVKIRRMKKIKKVLKYLSIVLLLYLGVIAIHRNNSIDTYYVESEAYSGRHYELMTQMQCKVVDIRPQLMSDDDIITVDAPDGQQYEFYGNGFKLGSTITCVFNESMELVDINN